MSPDRVQPDRRTPVERFLGDAAIRGGAAGLLGLDAASLDNAQIVRARDRALERIDGHPERDTPAADEVRLAVHAAAAQLLHPGVRRHIAGRSTRTTGSAPADRSARAVFEQDVLLTLGLCGGWNSSSMRRLVWLAHARGLPAAAVVEALQHIVHRRGVAIARPAPNGAPVLAGFPRADTASAPAPRPEPVERGPWAIALAVSCSAVIAAALLGYGAWALVDFGSRQNGAPRVADTGAPMSPPHDASHGRAVAEPDASEPELAPRREFTAPEIIEELRLASYAFDPAPAEAHARFDEAVEALSVQWPSMRDDQLLAAHDAIIEFLYRASVRIEDMRIAVERLGRDAARLDPGDGREFDPEATARAVWSVGMLTRLRRETDLPEHALARVRAILRSTAEPALRSEPVFARGASAALALAADRILRSNRAGDPELWRAWLHVADRALGADAGARTMAITRAAERMMARAREDASDSRDALEALLGAVDWRDGDRAARWFVRLFDSREIPAAALVQATDLVAGVPLAPGLDPGMVLAPSAAAPARRDLRDRYAGAWNLEDLAPDDAFTDAVRKALDADPDTGRRTPPLEHLRYAVRLARLNTAAWLDWRGDHAGARAAVENLDDGLDIRTPSAGPRSGAANASDGRWALRYLEARQDTPQRLGLLLDLQRAGSTIGPVDAGVLAAEAVRGTPRGVRDAALDTLTLKRDAPAVVEALLGVAHQIPRTQAGARLIAEVTGERVPVAELPEWRITVRRALVRHLLDLVAGEGELGVIDEFASMLADSYAARGPAPATSGGVRSSALDAAALAREEVARWRDAAAELAAPPIDTLSPDAIERRRASRLALAEGVVQRFAAEQLAAVETQALVVASERPDLADDVRAVFDRLAARRRDAGHIFVQLAATERATAELWRLRRDGGTP